MTRADYRLKVQNEVDDTSSGASSVINEAIREIYAEIASEISPFVTGQTSETVAVTSNVVTLSGNYMTISAVHYTESGTYDEISIVSEDELLAEINYTGTTPTKCVIRGNTIVLNGLPTTGTLRVQGITAPAEMTDDTVVSIVPDRYARVIVLGACYRFFGYEKGP